MIKQRRIFALSAVAMLTGMAIAAACSFPEPRVIDGDGGATPDVTTDTGNGDDDSGTDGGGPIDDAGPPPIVDANGAKPDVDVDGCVCDCDGDKFRSATQSADACAPTIEPGDCDDVDPRANPDSGWVADQPTKDTQGNWDCDQGGTVTAEYGGNLNCGALDLSVPCAKRMGFTGNPGCGEEGDFVQCEPQGLGGCAPGPPVKKKRACK